MWHARKPPPPPYDPLRDRSAEAVRLSDLQAQALRCLEQHGSFHSLFGETAQLLADEYRMDRWLRDQALIDPYDKLTRKGLASLHGYDDRFSIALTPRSSNPVDEEEQEDNYQRIRVPLDGGRESLSIRVAELETEEWFAETLVPIEGSKRKRRLEQYGNSKADVLHKIIHAASVMRAKAHARINS